MVGGVASHHTMRTEASSGHDFDALLGQPPGQCQSIFTMTIDHNTALRLWAVLRDNRILAHRTQRQVAQAMDWSLSKVLRIETGAVGISTTDLRALLTYYGTKDEQQIEELVELARIARTRKGSRRR
ncbi:MAG: helix-turn-helix domain-containing protein [Pseudonocardiaceae bacterium]